jgi:hypothetical protein
LRFLTGPLSAKIGGLGAWGLTQAGAAWEGKLGGDPGLWIACDSHAFSSF